MRFASQIRSLVFSQPREDPQEDLGLIRDLIGYINLDVITAEQMDQEGNKFRLVNCDYPFIVERRGSDVVLLAEITLGESLISRELLLRDLFSAIERQVARNRFEKDFNKWFAQAVS